ncbi:MAG: M14 metallopeptidase family protein [Pseudomonadota bacterium]
MTIRIRNFVSTCAAALFVLASSLIGVAANAASPQPTSADYWPTEAFDPAIPTLEAVAGHASGAAHTRPGDIVAYLEALAAAAPDRMKVFDYATSWQGRRLVYGAIASPENLKRLDGLKEGMASLADPRGTDKASADALIADLPAAVWLSYGVHGDEISPPDAALAIAYHLLAATDDPLVTDILKNTVVFIDPIQNPDGRNRFIESYVSAAGLAPSGSRIAAERNQPWPRGRTNHYLFDMNRDWIAQSQPETIGRIAALKEWRPLVVVDAHEMGTDETFYFPPEAEPINPFITDAQMAMSDELGRNNARRFDEFGFDYFTREVYDKLFPGYGDSWPAFYGAIAMTFEQGSPRGMKARRTDGSEFTYKDAIHRQFVASLATLETASKNRERLLSDFRSYAETGLEEGRNGAVKSYIFPAGGGADVNADDLAEALLAQELEVFRAREPFSACGGNYPKGAFVASLAQPKSRMLRTLLDPTSPMKSAFIEEQERRRARGLPDEIYDVTAWSPALALNVRVAPCETDVGAGSDGFEKLAAPAAPSGEVSGPREAVAYAVDWGDRDAIRFLASALRDGLSARSADRAFTVAGRRFPAGSLVFLGADHEKSAAHLRARLLQHAEKAGVTVHALSSTYLDAGDNFGGGRVKRLVAPNIAIAWDEPTNPNAAGAARFVIERRFGYPVTPVRTKDLSDKGLDQFDVLILPTAYGSGYGAALGGSGANALRAWVADGGVLIAMDRAARFVADPSSDLSAARREDAYREDDAEDGEEDGDTVAGALIETAEAARAAIEPEEAAPDATSGVFARAVVDGEHWLAAGAPDEVTPLVRGGDIYRPLRLDEGVNVVSFAAPDELLAGGYLWEETRKQLAYKPFLMSERIGDGLLITFTQDPTFRAQLGGLDVLVANAVFRAPARSGKLR